MLDKSTFVGKRILTRELMFVKTNQAVQNANNTSVNYNSQNENTGYPED